MCETWAPTATASRRSALHLSAAPRRVHLLRHRVQREGQSYPPHGMRRLVAVLFAVLVLDTIGTFGPTPVCDPGAPSIPCLSAVVRATAVLPPGHADIASIWF